MRFPSLTSFQFHKVRFKGNWQKAKSWKTIFKVSIPQGTIQRNRNYSRLDIPDNRSLVSIPQGTIQRETGLELCELSREPI